MKSRREIASSSVSRVPDTSRCSPICPLSRFFSFPSTIDRPFRTSLPSTDTHRSPGRSLRGNGSAWENVETPAV